MLNHRDVEAIYSFGQQAWRRPSFVAVITVVVLLLLGFLLGSIGSSHREHDADPQLAASVSPPGRVSTAAADADSQPGVDPAAIASMFASVTKQSFAEAAKEVYGASVECSPSYDLRQHLSKDPNDGYYEGKIMAQYNPSYMHNCNMSLRPFRITEFLKEVYPENHGSFNQCPEAREWFTSVYYAVATLGRPIRYCEAGFGNGHSAAVALSGAQNIEVVSFDFGSEEMRKVGSFLRRVFGDRFTLVEGNLQHSVSAFARQWPNFKCDIIFFDTTVPMQLELFRAFAMPRRTLVLYHWAGTQTPETVAADQQNTFKIGGCMKVKCQLGPFSSWQNARETIVREHCWGQYL